MATMIPSTPRDFAPASLEDVMFRALEQLPSEYYVFHSFRIMNVSDGIVHESETDFVIFSKDKGLLCLEAKAGQVSCREGRWCYGSGLEMAHGGPFLQAANNEYKIRRLFENRGLRKEMESLKTLHAVWFPSISSDRLTAVSFPSDGDRRLVMTKEDLANPLPSIERLFSLVPNNRKENNLTDAQAVRILNEVLCPAFDLFVSPNLAIDLERSSLKRMLDEQVKVLDFLDEQPFAAINGSAGTGKTMLALEKAQRCAFTGEKVLFLCFNRYLRDHLVRGYENDLIDFYTIDGLAAKMLGGRARKIEDLPNALTDAYLSNTFNYKHVIVDEGQDFGQDRLEESGVLQSLCDIALDQDGGTFFVFYDSMQLVQSNAIPACIRDAECRIVLRRNCRNTENIAITSMKSLHNEKKPLMKEDCVKGVLPVLYLADEEKNLLDSIELALRDCFDNGFKDIVLLSCEPLEKSCTVSRLKDGYFHWSGKPVPITTCRKFKGLEADAIVLIDVNKESILGTGEMLFYVGASRARYKLNIVAFMNDEDCLEVLRSFGRTSRRRPRKMLATCLNTMLA